jgi:hypothetical protein
VTITTNLFREGDNRGYCKNCYFLWRKRNRGGKRRGEIERRVRKEEGET